MKIKRPASLDGSTPVVETGCGKLYITVNLYEGKPFEVFLHHGKAGGCASAQCESIGRLVALHLRKGGSVEEVVKQLKGISCHQQTEHILSCADAVGKVLETYITISEEEIRGEI